MILLSMLNIKRMKKILLVFLICFCSYTYAQKNQGVTFNSTDKALQTAFERAKTMALSYKGKTSDPVGPWYESALPPRSAFCMRDVAHQSIGGEILGLAKENKNMFRLFAKNISENKDWCSYWEINHLGEPAKDDYRNDKEFWYNLNANFDILNACWKLYLWTGDKEYIKGGIFTTFHEKSVTDYISRWVLSSDSLLSRPAHPNAPVPFNNHDSFHRCRGLPSYSEGVLNIKMGVDLIAAIYRGLLSYAAIMESESKHTQAEIYTKKALAYQEKIEEQWWDENASRYYTYYSNDHQFGRDEGETFLLWFDALKAGPRKEKTLQYLNANKWNVENLSYFPLIMYQNGYETKADEYILHLTDPATKRREYPEVSFGVIKGITEGLMGIEADARYNRISSLYRSKKQSTSTINDVPVLGTLVTLKHSGTKKSSLINTGKKEVSWRVKFSGNYKTIYVNTKAIQAEQEKDNLGNTVSYADILVKPGKEIKAGLKL